MECSEWTRADAADWIAQPDAADDKYSRGVLGVITGSDAYPGAAVLGVEAAMHTGVGMVRYLGGSRAADFVLHRRPEIVTADGRVQAWLMGSGMDAAHRGDEVTAQLRAALGQELAVVVDAGALDLLDAASGPVVITPHFGELARVLSADTSEIAADPGEWASRAADQLGVTVLLKGSSTRIADPHGTRLTVGSTNAWTATAGAGDALGGILGALVATHAEEIGADRSALSKLAATASVLHREAAGAASAGGPFTIIGLAEALPGAIAGVLHEAGA